MAEASPITMGKLFTDLVGQRVTFCEQQYAINSAVKQTYCTYLIKPMDSTRVIKAEMPLLTSFAGALIGLPLESIKERVAIGLPPDAQKTLRASCCSKYFNVTIDSYEGGAFSMLAPW
jgi:hypothetical protein